MHCMGLLGMYDAKLHLCSNAPEMTYFCYAYPELLITKKSTLFGQLCVFDCWTVPYDQWTDPSSSTLNDFFKPKFK